MRIEAALKHFNPKSQQITESKGTRVSGTLNSTDVMAAFGMCPEKVAFGLHAYLGKAGISERDR